MAWGYGWIARAAEAAFAARATDLARARPAALPPPEWDLPIHRPGSGRKKRPEVVAATRTIQDQLRIDALLDRIPAAEFIYPADTAAARTWNLATLAQHGIGSMVGAP